MKAEKKGQHEDQSNRDAEKGKKNSPIKNEQSSTNKTSTGGRSKKGTEDDEDLDMRKEDDEDMGPEEHGRLTNRKRESDEDMDETDEDERTKTSGGTKSHEKGHDTPRKETGFKK
jgi:hypothetical protein